MAIDPSISLHAGEGVTQPDPLGAFQKVANLNSINQQISASQTQQLATQAQIPGMQADSEIKQRTAAFNAWSKQNSKIWSDPSTPGFDKALGYSPTAAVSAMASAGFGDMADATSTHAFQVQAGNIKNADDAMKVQSTAITNIANTVGAMRKQGVDEPTIQAYIKRMGAGADQIAPALGMSSVLAPLQDPKVTAGVQQGTITPQQVVTNAQTDRQIAIAQQGADASTESVAQAGVSGVTGPAARNPSSPESQQAQSDYLKANPDADPDKVKKLSAADIQHMTGPSGVVAANVVPASTKSAAATAGTVNEAQAQIMDGLQGAAAKLARKGVLDSSLTVDNWVHGQLSTKLTNDPDVVDYLTRLKQAQDSGIPLPNNVSTNGMSQAAGSQARTLRDQAKANQATAKQPNFSNPPGTIGTVLMVNTQTGTTIRVPKDKISAAQADGFKLTGAQ